MKIHSKAPGKVLWLGGYSVLEKPNTSLVTTVDAYVHAFIKPNRNGYVKIKAPQHSEIVTGNIDPISGAIQIMLPSELKLLKTSLEVATMYSRALGVNTHGFDIETKSDDQIAFKVIGPEKKIVKSGLGSSAAVTVASISAVLKYNQIDATKEEIHKLAQLAHSIATGKVGSGFDIAAATFGSISYSRYSPDLIVNFPKEYSGEDIVKIVKKKWDYNISKVELPSLFSPLIANFSGESAITTSMVGRVNEFKAKNPNKYGEIMGRIDIENQKAINTLKELINEEQQDLLLKFRDGFDKGRILTKELGKLSKVEIEPDDCTKLIERSVENGAFVSKLPGSGGKDSIAALCLNIQLLKKLKKFWTVTPGLEILDIRIINEGFIISVS